MAIKYPLEYEITPTSIDTGRHWVTLRLKNIGAQDLTGLANKLARAVARFDTGTEEGATEHQ